MGLGVENSVNAYIQNYRYQQGKTVYQNKGTDFNSVLSAKGAKNTENLQGTEDSLSSRVEKYTEYLKSKYGNVTIESIGKDQASLNRAGKSMNGNDVIIAPNILEQMANDPEKAAYYEGKIDDFFDAIPSLNASFAAKGLVHQPCGVIVHEDGSVTYIGGCGDSPERVAEVNAINKAKREKEAKQRKELLERSQEETELKRQVIEKSNQEKILAESLEEKSFVSETANDVNASSQIVSAVSAYENVVNTFSEHITRSR